MVALAAILECCLLVFASLTLLGGSQQTSSSAGGTLYPISSLDGRSNGSVSFLKDNLNLTLINSTSFRGPWIGAVNYWNGNIYIADLGGRTLSALNPSNNSVSTFLNIPKFSGGLAFSRSGQIMYLLNSGKYGDHYRISIYNMTDASLITNVSVSLYSSYVACNPVDGSILVPNNSGALTIVSGENYTTRTVSYVKASSFTNEQVVVDRNSDRLFLVTDGEIVAINATTYTEVGNISGSSVGHNLTFNFASVNEAQNLIYIYADYYSGGQYIAAYNVTTLEPVWTLYRHVFVESILEPFYTPGIVYNSHDNAVFLLADGPSYDFNGPGLAVLNGSTGSIETTLGLIPYTWPFSPNGIIYDSTNGLVYIIMSQIGNYSSGDLVSVEMIGSGNYGPSTSVIASAQILRCVGVGFTAIVILAAVWIPYLYVESRNFRKRQ